MGQPYIGEIRMFGGNFAPAGWAFCDGSLLPISENDALFALIGTTYGGDGQSTFALPDLRGRIPIHQGTGPGGQTYIMGEMSGAETATLTVNQLPLHTHPFTASSANASETHPVGRVPASAQSQVYQDRATDPLNMSAAAISSTGGGQPHGNMMPYLPVSFIISLFGIFPSQT